MEIIDPQWKKDAACRAASPEIFDYVDKDHPQYTGDNSWDVMVMEAMYEVALGYCASCPVLDLCDATKRREDSAQTVRGGRLPGRAAKAIEKFRALNRTCEKGHRLRPDRKSCGLCRKVERDEMAAAVAEEEAERKASTPWALEAARVTKLKGIHKVCGFADWNPSGECRPCKRLAGRRRSKRTLKALA